MADSSQLGKLSSILLKRGSIDTETLKSADEQATATGVTLERYLLANDLIPDDQVTLAISEYLGIPPMSLAHFAFDEQLAELVPIDVLARFKAIPVARLGKMLTVAMGDPFDITAIDELHIITGLEIAPVAASEDDIARILQRSRAQDADQLDMEDIMKGVDSELEVGTQEEGDVQSLEDMRDGAQEGPVIRMVNMILIESVRLAANDIHLEPQEDYVRLRYRVDGVLIERPNLPKSIQSALISRVKIMADLDIGEHRIPQDGRFRIKTLGKAIDVRVSVLPTIHGGKVVMRTLDSSSLFPSLAALELEERAHNALAYAIEQPHGIILVTGPTGSGKTTTLYSCIQELNKTDVNLVTCEDPVEFQLPGIIQVKISEGTGCTFAAALRAILRQDPDIVLIGEIRDAESCAIAIKAALTGHLVLTTLHANDAAGTITRLLDMGMEPFLLASSIILTQAQRLYRRLCPVCKVPVEPDLRFLEDNAVDPATLSGFTLYGPKGCPKCNNIGFKGRAAIMEVLPIDDEIRAAIVQQLMADEIREKAIEKGMIPLQTAGLERVKSGDTSLETALRVTGGGE